jgi:hypothetical protein
MFTRIWVSPLEEWGKEPACLPRSVCAIPRPPQPSRSAIGCMRLGGRHAPRWRSNGALASFSTDRRSVRCSVFWLVTAPADDTKEKTFQKLQGAVRDVAAVHKWDLPDLKARPRPRPRPLESAFSHSWSRAQVGTLDSLMELSDELIKSDLQIEGMVHKIGDMTTQVYSSDSEKKGTVEQLTINDSTSVLLCRPRFRSSIESSTELVLWIVGLHLQ